MDTLMESVRQMWTFSAPRTKPQKPPVEVTLHSHSFICSLKNDLLSNYYDQMVKTQQCAKVTQFLVLLEVSIHSKESMMCGRVVVVVGSSLHHGSQEGEKEKDGGERGMACCGCAFPLFCSGISANGRVPPTFRWALPCWLIL